MSHLTAYLTVKHSPEDQSVIGLDIFKTLLPGPASNPEVPPICGRGSTSNKEMLLQLYSRFGNNNFSMHSHLSTYGYGIFPLTSRVFNHSCLPNAVARYSISSGAPVRMEIVSLRDITAGEQVNTIQFDRRKQLLIVRRLPCPTWIPPLHKPVSNFYNILMALHVVVNRADFYGISNSPPIIMVKKSLEHCLALSGTLLG